MNILGIVNLDNASAALIAQGRVVAASEEERFARSKHYCGLPTRSAAFCLEQANLSLAEVDEIAVGWVPYRGIAHRMWTTLLAAVRSRRLRSKVVRGGRYFSIIREQWSIAKLLGERLGETAIRPVHYVNHHLAHLACGYYLSPFERAAAISIDGTGEYQTCVLAKINEGKIKRLQDIRFPHSLGHLYSVFTRFLGFRPNSNEGKVMGLAAYGEPKYADAIRQCVQFDAKKGRLHLDSRYIDYTASIGGCFPSTFRQLFGEPRTPESELDDRHRDLAASIQQVTEEIVIGLTRRLHDRTGLDDLVLSGGVALNCVANAKVLEQTPFKRIYVPSAPSDAGVSLGAAMFRYHTVTGRRPELPDCVARLGPAFSGKQCAEELQRKGFPFRQIENVENTVAKLLADGKIVGWFQGAMEFGPRALGSRSILAAPFPAEMKDILNHRVKFREPFRPFAPIVLRDRASDWFEFHGDSPHMSFAFCVRDSKRAAIPAVTHIDGRARLQTVEVAVCPRLARLLECFAQITDIPVLLNTSFNVRGQPIVRTPAEAIDCFARTEMDCLLLEDCLVWRNEVSDDILKTTSVID